MNQCGYKPDAFYMPCTRDAGHDGPCAHEVDHEAFNSLTLARAVDSLHGIQLAVRDAKNAYLTHISPCLGFITITQMLIVLLLMIQTFVLLGWALS
jgi:hypothetical protein